MKLVKETFGRISWMMIPLICIASLAVCDPEWFVEEIVTTPAVLNCTDLVLDSTDQPHVAFIAANKLIYADRESGTWSLDTLSSNGASAISIDLFSSDIPAIAYVDNYYPYAVKYMYFNGSSWQAESISCVLGGTKDVCLAIDNEDIPRVLHHRFCYFNPYNAYTDFYFYTREPTGWEYDKILSYNTVDEGQVYNFDLDLTPFENHPRVTYSHSYYSTFSFEYAWPDQKPEYWNWLVVAFGLDAEYENSLDVDPNGISHCSFRRYSNLYYAIGNTAGFMYEVVDSEDGVAKYSDVQADIQSIPHIVYDAPDGLRYATKPGSNWVFNTVGPLYSTIRDPSICLDSSGNPHIAWIDTDSSRIMYAHYFDPTGISSPIHRIGTLVFNGVYPNPFSTTALAEFTLMEPARVVHGIFSLDGRLVWEDSYQYPAGICSMQLPHLETGVYIYRMKASNQVETRYFTVCN